MGKRFVYILLSEECEVLATETSVKKIHNKHADSLALPSYQHLNRLVRPTKEEGGEADFKGKDGTMYKIAARRIQ